MFPVLPHVQRTLTQLGNQIKLARLRRNLSADLIAERAGISRATLHAIEKGAHSVSLGAYAMVLHSLGGLDKDLLLVAKDERMEQTMRELQISIRKRASKRKQEKTHGK
ncbi:MAG: helix-turn-helix transcriptional regulator [Schwartzia sp.]|nr:helix-turn-helix transcriptional regulator [Schwartzia sp. (in: firmicutes)]